MNYSIFGDIFDVMLGPSLSMPDPTTMSILLMMGTLEWYFAPKVRKPKIYHVAKADVNGF